MQDFGPVRAENQSSEVQTWYKRQGGQWYVSGAKGWEPAPQVPREIERQAERAFSKRGLEL